MSSGQADLHLEKPTTIWQLPKWNYQILNTSNIYPPWSSDGSVYWTLAEFNFSWVGWILVVFSGFF